MFESHLPIVSMNLLSKMDEHFDGHVWTITKTNDIKKDHILIFQYATCVGHLVCPNSSYTHQIHNPPKMTLWAGITKNKPQLGSKDLVKRSTFACKHCLTKLECVSLCFARMFNIAHYMQYVNKVCIHLGEHKHPMVQGECRETWNAMKTLVQEKLHCYPKARVFTIALVVEKT